jgi:hypothetical protein
VYISTYAWITCGYGKAFTVKSVFTTPLDFLNCDYFSCSSNPTVACNLSIISYVFVRTLLIYFFLLRVAFHQGNLLASLYVPYYNLVYNICHILQKRLLTLTFFSQGGEKGQSFFSYKRYM